MPIADADKAIRAIRDSYDFSFLGVQKKSRENTVRRTLVEKVARFMLELGAGFTYAGQEWTLGTRQMSITGNRYGRSAAEL